MGDCPYIEGNPHEADALMKCGAPCDPKRPGSSYCAYHYALCHKGGTDLSDRGEAA